MELLLLAAALLVGILLAVQASANLQLTKAVGTPYGASTLQLFIAMALLGIVAVAVGAAGAIRLVPGVEPWHLVGGIASPLYIMSGILLFPRLGALAAVGLFVTGQMFASLALDLFGLLGVPQRPLGPAILLGVAAVVVGITFIVRSQGGPSARTRSLPRAGWILLGVIAGAGLPVQGAVNAQLRADLGEPLAVGAVSFAVATLAIALVLAVLLAIRRTARPQLRPLGRMPWWGWLGGACAAAYVTVTFTLIPVIGAATTIALTVTGQQIASGLIDHYGLFRLPTRRLGKQRLAGLALLVAGSFLVQFS